jgi:hypothetical protein
MNRFPKTVDQLPTGEFHAILTPVSVTIPGDERSRQAPGHGYPEHTISHWEMEVFPGEEEWRAEILLRDGRPYERFKAVVIRPAVIKRTTEVL